MRLLGVTGGIGAGKSTTCRVLSELGIPWLDTDLIAREQSATDSEGLQEIVRAFGPDILDSRGELQRERLSRIVFADVEARRLLEGILHPRISKIWRDQVVRWESTGVRTAAVVIPLLFEKGYAPDFGRTICLGCTRRTQFARLRERSWSVEAIEARLGAQLPLGEKMMRADFVIWTEGSLHLHRSQWVRVLREGTPAICCPA